MDIRSFKGHSFLCASPHLPPHTHYIFTTTFHTYPCIPHMLYTLPLLRPLTYAHTILALHLYHHIHTTYTRTHTHTHTTTPHTRLPTLPVYHFTQHGRYRAILTLLYAAFIAPSSPFSLSCGLFWTICHKRHYERMDLPYEPFPAVARLSPCIMAYMVACLRALHSWK